MYVGNQETLVRFLIRVKFTGVVKKNPLVMKSGGFLSRDSVLKTVRWS
jgi:hypothetical protein